MEFNPQVLLVQIAILWTLMVVLNTLFFKPMMRHLDYRKSLTEGRRKEAEELLRNVADRESGYNAALHEARTKADSTRHALREQILAEQRAMLEAEQKRVDEAIVRERETLLTETKQLRDALPATARELGAAMATRVLGREV